MKNTEQADNSSIQQSYTTRVLQLPLMSKKMNSVQKYVNSYKINPKPTNQRNDTLFSSHAERLVFGGKLTPDPLADRVNQKKCYVKYESLLEQKTQQRLQQLNKIEGQYERLKSNLVGSKDVFTSKYTVPLQHRRPRKSESQMSRIELSQGQIQKQLRKQILVEDGHRYFADLYLMRKDRSEMKDEIQKNRKFTVKEEVSEDKQKQRQKFLLQKKFKEAEERKTKMLKSKGLHWNVYYEMLALSKAEKDRVKDSNSAFVSTYGVD